MGVLSEKVGESIEVAEIIAASKRLYGLARFKLYAISDGFYSILKKSYTGIKSFFAKPEHSLQIYFEWVT